LRPSLRCSGSTPQTRSRFHTGKLYLASYLNPAPIHEIWERWIGKYERHRLQALAELKRGLEDRDE
jgi:hypothetical protein